MAGTKQTWRHLCLRADDISAANVGGPSLTVELPRHVLIQGCDVPQKDVLISKRFQGAYCCLPEIVDPPAFGDLQFIGVGWVYVPKGAWVEDSFTYRMKANHLTSNLGTCTVR